MSWILGRTHTSVTIHTDYRAPGQAGVETGFVRFRIEAGRLTVERNKDSGPSRRQLGQVDTLSIATVGPTTTVLLVQVERTVELPTSLRDPVRSRQTIRAKSLVHIRNRCDKLHYYFGSDDAPDITW